MGTVAILVSTLEVGGAEKQAALLARALSRRFQLLLIVWNGGRVDDAILSQVTASSAQIVLLSGGRIRRVLELLRILRVSKVRTLFSYLLAANLLGAICGRLSGVPRIYAGVRNTKLPPWKAQLERFINRYLVSSTICNSEAAKAEVFGSDCHRVHVIPNCIVAREPCADRGVGGRVRIVSVARFVPQKDYGCAIDVAGSLAQSGMDFEYLILGYGPLESEIRARVMSAGLDGLVKIIPPPHDVPSALASADLYLSTSRYEGFSNSIMEAMSCGLPIVCTDVGDNRTLVISGENGYVCRVGDVAGISSAVAKLASSAPARREMGRRSYERVYEVCGIDTFVESYEKLIT